MKATLLLGGVRVLLAQGFPDTAEQLITTYRVNFGKLDNLSAYLPIYIAQVCGCATTT